MQEAQQPVDIPHEYICPISRQIMLDPVIAADGITYERKFIQKWLTRSHDSPFTGARLLHKTVIPNIAIKQSIATFNDTLPQIQKVKQISMDLEYAVKVKEDEVNNFIKKAKCDKLYLELEEERKKVQYLKGCLDQSRRKFDQMSVQMERGQRQRKQLIAENRGLRVELEMYRGRQNNYFIENPAKPKSNRDTLDSFQKSANNKKQIRQQLSSRPNPQISSRPLNVQKKLPVKGLKISQFSLNLNGIKRHQDQSNTDQVQYKFIQLVMRNNWQPLAQFVRVNSKNLQLREIKQLCLEKCEIKQIPWSIYCMSHVQKLNLSQNHISKIQHIGEFSQMIELNLNENNISKIQGVGHFKFLRKLWLASNKIEKIETLPLSLYVLCLSHNMINDVTEDLSKFQKISHFYLDSNRLKSLKGLEVLNGLKELRVFKNPLVLKGRLNDNDTKIVENLEGKGVKVRLYT